MRARAHHLACLGVAAALSACGYSEDRIGAPVVARDSRGNLHLAATVSHGGWYFIEGAASFSTIYAFQGGRGWVHEKPDTVSATSLQLLVAPDGRAYIPPPANQPLARVEGRWQPLDAGPPRMDGRTAFSDVISGVAWAGSDGRLRVLVPGSVLEFDGARRVNALPIDLNCGSFNPLDFTRCQFAPSGDRAGDLVRFDSLDGRFTRAAHMRIECGATACTARETGNDFVQATGAPLGGAECALLRTARGTPTLACGVGTDVVVGVPGRQVASVPLMARLAASFAARATQGVLASVRTEGGGLTLLAIDEDGAARRVPLRLDADLEGVSDRIPVLGGMSGPTETADLFIPKGSDRIEHVTVSIATGAELARESIAMNGPFFDGL